MATKSSNKGGKKSVALDDMKPSTDPAGGRAALPRSGGPARGPRHANPGDIGGLPGKKKDAPVGGGLPDFPGKIGDAIPKPF